MFQIITSLLEEQQSFDLICSLNLGHTIRTTIELRGHEVVQVFPVDLTFFLMSGF